MTKKIAYSYTILRYIHDVLTGEFVNVGVVLFMPHTRAVRFKTRITMGRLKGAFPDIDRSAFVASMHSVRRSLQRVAKAEENSGFLTTADDAAGIARLAVPLDESSLQWSSPGSGLTDNIDQTLDRVFSRFVARYDSPSRNRRTDDDVWRPVRKKLEERHLDQRLQEKIIQGKLDQVIFKNAWKNGMWNVYEPVSFDLADSEGIKTKAREWLGHLSAVVAGGRAEKFKPHFVVGAPMNPALDDAYRTAIAILENAPNNPEVFEEAEVDALVNRIESDVRAHSS